MVCHRSILSIVMLIFLRYQSFAVEGSWSQKFMIASSLCSKNLGIHSETAVTLQYIGRHRKSMRHLQEAMKLFELCLGEHFMTALSHKAIAGFYLGHFFNEWNSSELDICCEHYREALTMMESVGVGDHKESIVTLKNYALCHKSKENYQEAINTLMKAKQVAEIELEEDYKWKVMTKTHLALIYNCILNEEEAKVVMKRALEMSKGLNQPISKLANKTTIKEFLSRYPEVSRILMRSYSH